MLCNVLPCLLGQSPGTLFYGATTIETNAHMAHDSFWWGIEAEKSNGTVQT
jgi:hypothetical protein